MLNSAVQQAFSSPDDDAFQVHFLTQSQSWTWINDLPTPFSPKRRLRMRLRMLQYPQRKFSYTLNNSLEICHCIWLGPFEYFLDMCATDVRHVHSREYVCHKHRHRDSIFKVFPQKGLFKHNILKNNYLCLVDSSFCSRDHFYCRTVHTFVS